MNVTIYLCSPEVSKCVTNLSISTLDVAGGDQSLLATIFLNTLVLILQDPDIPYGHLRKM